MISAFSRLIRITLVTISCLFFVVFGLRFMGASQKFASIEHPLLEKSFIWVASAPPENAAEGFEFVTPLRLRLDESRAWMILNQDDNMSVLKDWTSSPKAAGVWLEVIDPTATSNQFAELSEFFKERGLSKAVFFTSPYQKLIRDMRKLEPMWLYASSTAESARLRFLTSIFLETIATIDADILVLDKTVPERLLREIHKRHKKLFIRMKSQFELPALKGAQKIDGAIVAP